MLPIARKSVEPMAASLDPLHASARHQALHHFVAQAEWSDEEMLRRVAQWVVPRMDLGSRAFWIIDDTGYPKKGKHSVGVARQYCGQLGKQDNCQVAVSISLASETASLPVAYRLYLPKDWARDRARRRQARVPAQVRFPDQAADCAGAIGGVARPGRPASLRDRRCRLWCGGAVPAAAQRDGIALHGGDQSAVSVWPQGVQPLPPKRYRGRGRPPLLPRRSPQRQPVSVKALAQSLPSQCVPDAQLARRNQ